ncbi:Ig-like domain-containing protein [Paenarthrobacter sp. NPDC057981]|uniref:Ig-like domain-containing protein n=1 Tax=Paenarthrobacter sp. NPDC057981 TaxID=3346297 RepID=UPI0036D7FF5D
MSLDHKDSAAQALFSAEGWVPFVVGIVARVYLGISLSLAVIALFPALLGWGGSVVQSGSMEPHISPGDVVLSSTLPDTSPVPLGGVVEFLSPAEAEPDGVGKTRLHRIVGANDDGSYITAGDANTDVDSTPMKREQITGQARLLVPMVGLPGLWLTHGTLPQLAVWSVGTLLAVVCAIYLGGSSADGTAGTARARRDGQQARRRSSASIPAGLALPVLWTNPRVKAVAAFLLAALIAILVVLGATAGTSAAAFTSVTSSTGNKWAASADWNPPTVLLADPGTSVRDTVALQATAQDAESGIRSIDVEYLRDGASAWTNICSASSAAVTCQWNTKAAPDGGYSLRARATDNAGLASVTALRSTTVANNLLVVLASPAEAIRGNVPLSTTLLGAGNSIYTVRVEYSLAGANKWSIACPSILAPYNCTWNTALVANESYDLRAVAVSGLTTTYSAVITDITVDNLAPTVALTDPGTPLSGVRTLAATSTDAHSGVAQVSLQYARTGTSTWGTACTVVDSPYSCRFDTTTLTDGGYSFRAVSMDAAGNSTTSAAVSRTVDNTVASVSLEDPGAYLTGTVPLTAAANSTAGVAAVKIQAAPAGTTTWSTLCTLAAAPYACNWNTAGSADGPYDLRAVLTDRSGKDTFSSTVASRRVDNSPLRAADIRATNGGLTQGRLESGDSMSFVYSQQVNPATVTPGWAGASLPVTVRLRDGNVLGLGNSQDVLDVQRAGSSVNLGSVNLKQNFVKSRKTVVFNATMTASTETVSGVPRTVVTVVLGTVVSGGSGVRTAGAAAAMVWTPTAAVTSLAGTACSLAPLTEPGTLDRDF